MCINVNAGTIYKLFVLVTSTSTAQNPCGTKRSPRRPALAGSINKRLIRYKCSLE